MVRLLVAHDMPASHDSDHRWLAPRRNGEEARPSVTMADMERHVVERWVAGYERAWRTPGTDALNMLFTPTISYVPSPWAEPVVGLDALAHFWEAERDGPDEEFNLQSEVIAIEGRTAIVRVAVEYVAKGQSWRDLWVLRFDIGGRCSTFEE
jgi:hypothetical protein